MKRIRWAVRLQVTEAEKRAIVKEAKRAGLDIGMWVARVVAAATEKAGKK